MRCPGSRVFRPRADRLGLEYVRAYQVLLASKGVAWGSLNQVMCALLLRGEPRKLETVLSADEVVLLKPFPA
jgi:hypothetical protein